MKIIATLLFSAVFLLAADQASAQGNAQRGAAKAKAVCATCHEVNGVSKTPDFPILAGQYEDYLRESLLAYKRGDRKNAIMKGQAASLSEQDIADLAAYYSQQKPALKTAY